MTQDKLVLVPRELDLHCLEVLVGSGLCSGTEPCKELVDKAKSKWERLLGEIERSMSAAPTIAQPITLEQVTHALETMETCGFENHVNYYNEPLWRLMPSQVLAIINELPSQNESVRLALEKAAETVYNQLGGMAGRSAADAIRALIADEREG